MKPIAPDSKPERQLAKDPRVRAGPLDSAIPIPVSCLTLTHCVSSEHLSESVSAITCTTPSDTSIDQCNQQYSIYALTDSSGNVSERYAYTAYGQPTFLNATGAVQSSSASSNRYTYTGREWDQTIGLHLFRARWMSCLTGRFLTRDPIGFKGSDYLLYEYCAGTPIRLLDPSGLRCTTSCDENDIRTHAQCCKDALSAPAVDFEGKIQGGDGTFPGTNRGMTFCCDGRVVACVWPERVYRRNASLAASLIALHCIKIHEDSHIPDLETCPDKCPDLRWGKPKRGTFADSECTASKAQMSCILASSWMCFGDLDCLGDLDIEYTATRDFALTKCLNRREIVDSFPAHLY